MTIARIIHKSPIFRRVSKDKIPLEALIIADWKPKYGIPLFYPYMQDENGTLNQSMPAKYFTFQSVDGEEYDITYDNLETNVFLAVSDDI